MQQKRSGADWLIDWVVHYAIAFVAAMVVTWLVVTILTVVTGHTWSASGWVVALVAVPILGIAWKKGWLGS